MKVRNGSETRETTKASHKKERYSLRLLRHASCSLGKAGICLHHAGTDVSGKPPELHTALDRGSTFISKVLLLLPDYTESHSTSQQTSEESNLHSSPYRAAEFLTTM